MLGDSKLSTKLMAKIYLNRNMTTLLCTAQKQWL